MLYFCLMLYTWHILQDRHLSFWVHKMIDTNHFSCMYLSHTESIGIQRAKKSQLDIRDGSNPVNASSDVRGGKNESDLA